MEQQSFERRSRHGAFPASPPAPAPSSSSSLMYQQAARRILSSHVIPVEAAGQQAKTARMSSFAHVETAPPDPILGITTAFKVQNNARCCALF